MKEMRRGPNRRADPENHPVPGFVPARIPAGRAARRRFFQVRAMARMLWKCSIANRPPQSLDRRDHGEHPPADLSARLA